MKSAIRTFKLLNGNLGSLEQTLRALNPNTKLYISDEAPKQEDNKPRHLCSGIQPRELCYPVLRIGDTVWDIDMGLFIWNGKQWVDAPPNHVWNKG